jgi:hypothetical protein
MSEPALPINAVVLAPGEALAAHEVDLFASMPTRLVRRTGVEVRDNWIIDRDLGTVRRRYWGVVDPTLEPERC